MSQSNSPASLEPVEYRDIPGFPGYRAGSDGTIWTCKRRVIKGPGTIQWLNDGPWKKLSPHLHRASGRYQISIPDATGKRRIAKLHKYIALAFLGACPDGLEVCHENGVRTDNRVANLRYDTHVGNLKDSMRLGTVACGTRNASAKITEDTVREIRRLRLRGLGPIRISRIVNTSSSTVQKIIYGKNWKHVA